VRVRLHPAYTLADPECGKCVDAMQLKLRFPDANLDEFDTIEFQDSLSDYLGLEYDKIYLKSIEEGSVIATVVLLPQWIFEVPPNATSANATATEDPASGGKPKDEGISAGAFRASMSSGGANESMTEFRRKEFDPTTRDYSKRTLLRLENLLSSHYLPGIGQFNYVTTTAEKYCEFGQLSKEAIREKIEDAEASGFVWGKEVQPTDGLRTESVADMVYDSISRSNNTVAASINSFVQRNSFARDIERALSEVGSPVEIPELDISITGGIANFSAKNCTDCECQGKVESQQPFIEWQINTPV